MRLGTTSLPAGATLPDITDAVNVPATMGTRVSDILTGTASAYQKYLDTRAQIETARLNAKMAEARRKAAYKRAAGGGYYPGAYGGNTAPMKAGTKTMLMIGAGVLAVIAIGYTVIEKKKGKR